MFSRIAIVNRGEAAMRCIHAIRDRNGTLGTDLRSIACYTEAERTAMFVREADEAVVIGDAEHTGAAAYLDQPGLELALRRSGADAVWVGWGFVAENPEFAELAARLGVVFIGPGADVMRRLGDKISSKLLAEQAGVPVGPWSGGPVATVDDAVAHAATIGYPLMIKATAGGGGRGIRRVEAPSELAEAFERSRAEALRSFGDGTVFMERVVTGARHVEVQIVADDHGTVWALGVRDCSVQRRNQKLVEESASTALVPEQERELRDAAARLARLAGYRNAGTVEFLYQPGPRRFWFLEVNPRLQVEHPVTEAVTGVDIVGLQLHVAAGGRLDGDPPAPSGHAVEARLNAEDPERGFAPAPGTIEVLRFPTGPGIRVDTGVAEGDVIPAAFDSMIAKIVAWGRDREEALARLRRALAQTAVLVRGGTTNKTFLLDVLDRPELRAGAFDTGWLDRLTTGGEHVTRRHADVALLAAALDAFAADERVELTRFYSTAARGRPQARRTLGSDVQLRHRGVGYRFHVARCGPHEYTVVTEDGPVTLVAEHRNPYESRISTGGEAFRVVSLVDGVEHVVDVDGVVHRMSRDDGGAVRAPSPGVVIAVNVRPGDVVEAGSSVAVIEAMKMETTITAPMAGRVREVLATANLQVEAGMPLLTLEPIAGDGAEADRGSRVRFAGEKGRDDADAREQVLSTLATLRNLVLGFDVDDATARALGDRYRQARAGVPDDDPDVFASELVLLDACADLATLTRNPRDEGDELVDAAPSSREYLNAFLRSLDVEAEGLPESFRSRLLRTAAYYGITRLDRSAELEAAFARVFASQHRAASHVPGVAAILTWHHDHPDALPDDLRERFADTLERLVVATRLRSPVVGDLARSARVAVFDEPLIERTREAVYAEMREQRRLLASDPDAPGRKEGLEQLVACAQPLIWLLADREEIGAHDPLLEVLARRYYKVRDLRGLRTLARADVRLATAEYVEDGAPVTLVAALTESSQLERTVGVVLETLQELGGAAHAVDLYVWWDTPLPDGNASPSRVLADDVMAAAWPASVARVVVSVCAPGRGVGPRGSMDPVQDHCTLLRDGERWTEDAAVRGIHPMIAERLHLWRLANFDVERLRSGDDVYLFHCVAKDNPADTRMIAVAEVRDLTPLRDAGGAVTALPQLEQVLARCVDDLRRGQTERGVAGRLHWNRILLYVWPSVDAPPAELLDVAHALAPTTAGLGLEEVQIQARVRDEATGELHETVVHLANPTGAGISVRLTDPPTTPLRPLDEYARRVVESRRRGNVYPYELIPLLTLPLEPSATAPPGGFVEHDLDEHGDLVAVSRPPGGNAAAVVVGVVRSHSERYPEGVCRVAVLADPTKALGSVAEPECRRILAAIDLAEHMAVPVEWFAVSAGAAIAMDSGTENLDWVARVLRRLVEFTQSGGEVNVVVTGVNVGAQSYWNAESTMLMHTRGILVMTPDSSMVLTGKQALEFSGSVSAEDNTGIGGYARIMGPNGEAQYWAPDVSSACALLREHYTFAYLAPGETFPRPAESADPPGRDVCAAPYDDPVLGFSTVGEIFSEVTNPGRKRPFDIRAVMHVVVDADRRPLERWRGMQDAASAVVLDAFLGGRSVCLIGIESRPLRRYGPLPADGPDTWTGGTLFPLSSKKVARAINAASGNRPVVVLANLSGFDGSPESMRRLQLEYGAEIGRAIVNFAGPIVFCVISRYHGGAFVVFSRALNDSMEVVALTGSYASVIGGAPAAAVVFASEVTRRTRADERVRKLEAALADEQFGDRARLLAELADVTQQVRSEKLGEVAAEFDVVHSVERARQVGSVDRIIEPSQLRPYLVDAVRRGQEKG